jgi:hypothetical protein
MSKKLDALRLEIGDGCLDDAVDLKSEEASRINNDGVQAQIDYIIQSCGQERAVDVIEEALSESN